MTLMPRPGFGALLAAMIAWSAPAFCQDGDAELYEQWEQYMIRTIPGWNAHLQKWGEDIGWHHAPILRGLIDGYQVSGDTQWLDAIEKFNEELSARATRDQGHLGWGDSICGEALLLEPILRYITTVQTRPELRERYGPSAEKLLQMIDPEMIVKWDQLGQWQELLDGMGTYTEGITLPHNKNAHVGIMLLWAARATQSPERRQLYLEKATKLARRFKWALKLEDDHYIWHYWDAAGSWDYDEKGGSKHWTSLEHRGYGATNGAFVSQCYQSGIVFDRTDIERFCRTFTKRIWDGNREDPTFWALGRFNAEYEKSGIWSALAEYEPVILELLGDDARKQPQSWHGMYLVPNCLWMKQVGTGFEARYVATPAPE